MENPYIIAFFIGMFFSAVFGLLGVIFVIVALRARQKAKTSQSWPAAQGSIESATLREHSNADPEGSSFTYYEPIIQYRYMVMGQQYSGQKVGYGASKVGRSQAQKIIDRYTPGASVQVYYNPQNPQEAVLETQASGSKIFLIVGVIFVVVTLVACCISAFLGLSALA